MSRTPKPPAQPCSVARSAALLADPWTVLILRDALRGVRRFDDFQELTGAAKTVTADRLKRLVGEGLMTKTPYQTNPQRFEYRLTEKGRDVFPVMMTLWAWGDKYAASKEGPPILLKHAPCGAFTDPGLTCSVCGGPITLETIRPQPGPGSDTPEGRQMFERWVRAVSR